jgi:hypothetical protein
MELTDTGVSLRHGIADVRIAVQPEQRGVFVEG